jgi:hypothetical protein
MRRATKLELETKLWIAKRHLLGSSPKNHNYRKINHVLSGFYNWQCQYGILGIQVILP